LAPCRGVCGRFVDLLAEVVGDQIRQVAASVGEMLDVGHQAKRATWFVAALGWKVFSSDDVKRVDGLIRVDPELELLSSVGVAVSRRPASDRVIILFSRHIL